LVAAVSAAPQANREAVLRAWVKQQRRAGSGPRNESAATAFRNNLIRNGLAAGKERCQICETLDQHQIPITREMRRNGILNMDGRLR
jgi:hypothetical protein